MDTSTIRSEILRLQPWYYLFDLNGVCTDIAEPCQSLGHIKIDVGALGEIFAGKRVLDVGCNEGAWSFGAIDRGADSVVAFDCRDRNIEKAEFVKGVLGYEKVDFSVASIDGWLDSNTESFDVIVLSGILYHLPEPWDTIRRFCEIADGTIVMASVIWGSEENGYTQWKERVADSASHLYLDSLMPNNPETLIEEFAKHEFRPTHLRESNQGEGFGGGCTALFESARRFPVQVTSQDPKPQGFDIWIVPMASSEAAAWPDEVNVSMFNRTSQAQEVTGSIEVRDASGDVLQKIEESLSFEPRAFRTDRPASDSLDFRVPLELEGVSGPVEIEVSVAESGSSQVIDRCQIRLEL